MILTALSQGLAIAPFPDEHTESSREIRQIDHLFSSAISIIPEGQPEIQA